MRRRAGRSRPRTHAPPRVGSGAPAAMAVRAAMFGIRVSSAAASVRHAGASWLAAASTAVRSAPALGHDDHLPFALEGAMASTSGSDLGSSASADPLEVFRQALWLAVPKRKVRGGAASCCAASLPRAATPP